MMRATLLILAFALIAPAQTNLRFRAQQIADDFGIGYAVLAEDVDGDGKTDIVAINETTANWWSNPEWERHVVLDGKTEADNVAIAAHDIDGDGKLDLAPRRRLAALRHPGRRHVAMGRPEGRPSRGLDTAQHRRGADPATACAGAIPTATGRKSCSWRRCTAADVRPQALGGRRCALAGAAARRTGTKRSPTDTFHILHNFWVTNFDDDPADELLTASYEGVHLLDRAASGKWTRTKLGEGHQDGKIRGAGEIKLGRLRAASATSPPSSPGTPITS